MAFTFADVIADWEAFGVFDYVLPFLIIFAVVFGILAATNVFSGNKGVNLTVALAVALISLRFNYVPVFFSEIFPRFGIGLAVILVIMILSALFIPKQWLKGWLGVMWAVAGIVAITVIVKSFNFLGWDLSTGGWWAQYGSVTVLGIILVAIVAAIAIPKIEKGDGKADLVKFRD